MHSRLAASVIFIDPVSPYGYGGVRLDGTPCQPDYAGSGRGTGGPGFRERIEQHNVSDDSVARLIRSAARREREAEYVQAARALRSRSASHRGPASAAQRAADSTLSAANTCGETTGGLR